MLRKRFGDRSVDGNLVFFRQFPDRSQQRDREFQSDFAHLP